MQKRRDTIYKSQRLKLPFAVKSVSETNAPTLQLRFPFNHVAYIKLRNTTVHDTYPVEEHRFLHRKTKNNTIGMAHQLQPTVTFILPVQNEPILTIEQINSCFKFSEQYQGLCEIIIITDDPEENKVCLLWLATKFNKINHPHVRTKIIRYTSKLSTKELIETGIKHALGAKIVIATNNSGRIRQFQSEHLDMVKGDILTASQLLSIDALREALVKN